ncbi:uncharacterized protein LOC110861084 isoform X1 [Folsomia candida]|uniref:C-type lectin domain-containing protein n=1 Tax=Folsomia candida TaxID=158441 RepID=A0A226D5Z2_FOLCA|nr:uncharacterized protein LOC110861084 isoform X1 [Folsomia candida]OXA39676.1 hypothetical protein Fcan01_25489 [Folsomia candida]
MNYFVQVEKQKLVVKMWWQLQPLLLLGVVSFCATEDLALDSVAQGGSIKAQNYLGAWEGKRYYRAEDTQATWSESLTRCSSQGMVLADFGSTSEVAAVAGILDNFWYWTAGKLIPTFKWETTQGAVNVPVIEDDSLCVLINSAGFLHDAPCSGLAYTLCHT